MNKNFSISIDYDFRYNLLHVIFLRKIMAILTIINGIISCLTFFTIFSILIGIITIIIGIKKQKTAYYLGKALHELNGENINQMLYHEAMINKLEILQFVLIIATTLLMFLTQTPQTYQYY